MGARHLRIQVTKQRGGRFDQSLHDHPGSAVRLQGPRGSRQLLPGLRHPLCGGFSVAWAGLQEEGVMVQRQQHHIGHVPSGVRVGVDCFLHPTAIRSGVCGNQQAMSRRRGAQG